MPATPAMWNSGAPARQTASWLTPPTSWVQLTVCAKRFWCVSIAPFGRPVVPDVYISDATSSSSTSTVGTSADAAASTSSYGSALAGAAPTARWKRTALTLAAAEAARSARSSSAMTPTAPEFSRM